MKKMLVATSLVLGLSACSTTQQVMLGKMSIDHPINTLAPVKEEGNSTDMDKNLQAAVLKSGLQLKPALPEGTRKSDGVDALISYKDVWRWDVVMYLKSVSINIFDAHNGDLLVTGSWDNSALHGFQDSRLVVEDLLGRMVDKMRGAATAKP
jgi:hypothetical protein